MKIIIRNDGNVTKKACVAFEVETRTPGGRPVTYKIGDPGDGTLILYCEDALKILPSSAKTAIIAPVIS